MNIAVIKWGMRLDTPLGIFTTMKLGWVSLQRKKNTERTNTSRGRTVRGCQGDGDNPPLPENNALYGHPPPTPSFFERSGAQRINRMKIINLPRPIYTYLNNSLKIHHELGQNLCKKEKEIL